MVVRILVVMEGKESSPDDVLRVLDLGLGDCRGWRDGSRTTPVGPFTLPVGCPALSCDLDVRVRGGRVLREDAGEVFALLP